MDKLILYIDVWPHQKVPDREASSPEGLADPDVFRAAVLIRVASMESNRMSCTGGASSVTTELGSNG